MLCIWWNQKGVLYYELLKPGETINGERYRTQLISLKRAITEKRPEYATRHEAIIFDHDNASKKHLEKMTLLSHFEVRVACMRSNV